MNDRQTARPKRNKPAMSWWVWGLVILMAAFILFPIFAKKRVKARSTSCLSNLKQIALASLMYAEDYDGTFMRGPGWDDALLAYGKTPRLFYCPQDPREDTLSYGMNLRVAGRVLSTWDWERVESFEVPPPDHAAWVVTFYDGEGLEVIERHKGGANYAFLDGHAKWLSDPPGDSGLFVSEE